MKAVVFALPGNEILAGGLASGLDGELGLLEYRRFPDRESYLRALTDVQGKHVILSCTLDDPDSKTLPLLLAASAMRDLGAARIGLAAPYLGYMRQDRRFKDGEAITSAYYARLLSAAFDWLATVDPHLHRHLSLNEIYTIPSAVGHATPILRDYLRSQRRGIFLIGPDEESEQWVASLAADAGVPHLTLRKERLSDRSVAVHFPDLSRFKGLSPVLVDDVISSGRTMEAAALELRKLGFAPPMCLATHGVLAEDSLDRLTATGASLMTTNTIPGKTAGLDINPLFAQLINDRFVRTQT